MGITIAVSYAWNGENYREKVIDFVNYLRREGYNVIMDEYLRQQSTSIDFNEMMSRMITEADKVIVMLSKQYKERAERFEGGVGDEYRIILKEIKKNNNKYIFVSFKDDVDNRVEDLVPNALGNRDVIIICDNYKLWRERLFSKLTGEEIYSFNNVEKTLKSMDSKFICYNANNNDKKDVKCRIKALLAENKIFWDKYGPSSKLAVKNPMSDSVILWEKCKEETIIPNNKKIIEIFQNNQSLFDDNEIRIFELFRVHAFSFENNQITRQDNEAVTRFPVEFEKMIYEED